MQHSSILPVRKSRSFYSQFEVKAFKDLSKTDKYLLVIFINLATYINICLKYTIFFNFTFQVTYSNSSYIFKTLVSITKPFSEILNTCSQHSSSSLSFQLPEKRNCLNICMKLLLAILSEHNLCESTWSYSSILWRAKN